MADESVLKSGDPAHRKHELGEAIVRFALDHPDLADVSNWLLGTLDAHAFYSKLGFGPPAEPQRLMLLRRPGSPPELRQLVPQKRRNENE